MPRYMVQRVLGEITDAALEEVADASTVVREERFPEVVWEHSHVVRADDGLMAFCLYSAPGPGAVRDYSAAAGLPVDRIYEIHSDMVPHPPG